jgi:2-polyprenyl-3-methyl-5-hydroxy-6-metoxy-1,4-benzoquinol methylase
MQNQTQLNVDEIMARIRERVEARKRTEKPAAPPGRLAIPPSQQSIASTATPNLDRLRREVAEANLSHNLVGTINPRPKGLHNDVAQFLKKVMRRMLTWYTRPLHQFHGAVARSLNETLRAIEHNRSRVSHVEQELAEYRRSLEDHKAVTARLEDRFRIQDEHLRTQDEHLRTQDEHLRTQDEHLRIQRDEVDQRLRIGERNARRVSYLLNHQQLAESQPSALNGSRPQEPITDIQFDYFLFEERFRGKEAEIKGRQRGYLEYFRGRTNVVDLGCGRGEFLELLRENDIAARGVESGIDQFLLCQEKKLEVAHENLFSYLEQQPDASMGGIFSAQVIEHLPVDLQFRFVHLCKQKLSPGSPVIIETINPECIYALARNFYLDPTHVRPVHPELLKFVLETAGFEKVELKFSAPATDAPVPDAHFQGNQSDVQRFNELFHRLCASVLGFQDYAALAWR